MEKEILQVQMLGGFSMVYQGKTLVFDRNYTSKSTQLWQILFLHLENGIAKEQLLAELYSRDDVENRNGSLNNTIFRLRRQLEAAGLPKGKYFSLKDGIYRWDPVISVETDLSLFEKKLEESKEETDEEKKAELLKEACSMYTGELLPNMIGEDWAAVANIHYRDLYFEALQELCGYLKEKEHFEAVYQLTTAAAQIYPFEVWQLWRIDSLIAMNRYQDAIVVYKEATKHFFDDLGLPPSQKMLERFQLMSERIQQSVGALGEIKRGLREKEDQKGAYYCSFPSFIDIYHVIGRMMERNGISVYIMLCTLTDKNGEIRMGTDRNKEASKALKIAICNSLRRGDFYTRYNESQFLVMLSGTTLESCQVVSARIDRNFKKDFAGHFRINYYMASVAELREEREEDPILFTSAGDCWGNNMK